MLAGVPLSYVALTVPDRAVYLPAMFLAEVCVFLNTGPGNAVLVNVVMPEIRATAIAASIFAFHVLGDVPSPLLIGWVSDRSGSLTMALTLVSGAMGLSGIFYLWGSGSLARDMARVTDTLRAREMNGAPA
jgi:uncharacterized membrane protein YqaE (UPF0057 family)